MSGGSAPGHLEASLVTLVYSIAIFVKTRFNSVSMDLAAKTSWFDAACCWARGLSLDLSRLLELRVGISASYGLVSF